MPKKNEQIIAQTNEMPALEMRAAVVPSSIDEKERTIRVQYTTGARVLRRMFWEDDYYEELSTEKGHVRLERMQTGAAPVLNSHRNYDLSDVMGTVIEADETHATLKMSGRESMKELWDDIRSGVIRNVSVGYRVHKYEDITPDEDKIRVLRAIDWEPFEVSFVAIGADGSAGVRSGSQPNRCVVMGARSDTNSERDKVMPKDVKDDSRADDNKLAARSDDKKAPVSASDNKEPEKEPAAAPKSEGERSASDNSATAIEAERQRGIEIRKMVRQLELPESDADDMVARGITLDAARQEVINKMARSDENTNTSSRISSGALDESVTKREAIESALLHRSNPANELTDAGREFRGMSLIEICRDIVGYRESKGLSKREIAYRALHSSSDFPEILANIANKTLRQGYMDTKRSFVPFCRQGTLPDFKAAKRIALSNASSLEEVVEGGEYKRGTFTEGAETIQLSTYGKIVGITRQMIINDDLDAFTRVPQKMAATSARLENRMVYDIITSNPVMADGTTLFHTDHGNLTDALIGVTGIGTMRALMRVQTDPSGEDVMNLEPKYLIVPAALEAAALQLKTQLTPNQTSQVNPYSNTFEIIVEGYLDASSVLNYFMAASPAEVDTIEYAYLEGETGPYIESRNGFDVDGLEIKVRHDFATKAIDHRGLAKSTNNAA